MSGGFNPSDLARWALGGGANQEEEPEETAGENDVDFTPMTTEQLREQRLARMSGGLQSSEPQQKTAKVDHSETDEQDTPMKVDTVAESNPPSPPKIVRPTPETNVFEKPKPAKTTKAPSPDMQQRKQQRKNEVLLKKTLSITLAGGSLSTTSTASSSQKDMVVDIGTTEISTGTLAEIIVEFLNKGTQPILSHLGKAFEVAAQEAKRDASLKELITELQKQIVSYTATCTVEPDLFPGVSKDMPTQLADAFLKGDLAMTATGFYGKLVDELELQSPDALRSTVESVVDILLKRLKQNASILDTGVSDAFTIAAAFAKLCSKKIVAEMVCLLESFALPAAGTPEANLLVRPVMPTNSIQQFLAQAQRPYAKRSGPGLERHTILGSLLRLGLPRMSNPAFPPGSVLRQSPSTVDSLARTQQQQLHTYQQTVFSFVKALLKAGPTAKRKVLRWLTDALLVNSGASALRPDSSKVSTGTTLMNITVLLLNLCEPFVGEASKRSMLHASFCSSEIHHGGVFVATGDDAVARLGEGTQMEVDYDPKNLFVPFCFFFCARSLHFSLASSLSQHENLLRHIHHLHHEITAAGNQVHADNRFAQLISRQRADEVSLFQEDFVAPSLRFIDFLAQVLHGYPDEDLKSMPEDFCADMCSILLGVAQQKPRMLSGVKVESVFELIVKLLSPHYASIVRNYNLRAQFGDVLYELFLPKDSDGVPSSVAISPAGGTFLLASESARESLAPSLLLLYGEVEHTGFYEKMGYRAKIASLLKYLWDSTEHRPAFRKIAQNKDSFIKFANGIMNETNSLISNIMQKLPEIRQAQETMRNTVEWGQMSEDQQNDFTSRHEDNERNVKSSLPLCNKTLQMFGYLNTDENIRQLFLLDELCPRLVQMLVHVLEKMVGSRGLELKVDNPEQYEFRPKEMLRDLCAIFALFSGTEKFQEECARSGCNPKLLQAAIKTCRKQNLLTGQAMDDFSQLPEAVIIKQGAVAKEEELLKDAPDEFMDALLATFMKDPIRLPSGNTVDRSTITQHLLNEQNDPFNRAPLTVDDLMPDVELKAQIESWLNERRGGGQSTDPMDVEDA